MIFIFRGEHDLHEVATVSGNLDIGVVGVAEHDAGYDEEYSRSEELNGPEGDDVALAPHWFRDVCVGSHFCCLNCDRIEVKLWWRRGVVGSDVLDGDDAVV